jgi:hypothetical protein
VSRSSDPFQLHPLAIIGSLAATPRDGHPARRDSEPEREPERFAVHRRLLATLTRRLDAPRARQARIDRAG